MRLPETRIVPTKESLLGYVFEQQYIHGTKPSPQELQNQNLGHEIRAIIRA